MRCNDACQLMLAILDSESEDTRALAEHVRECSDCADTWRRLRQGEELLRSQKMIEAPEGLAETVVGLLGRRDRRPRLWRTRAAGGMWVLGGALLGASAASMLAAAALAVVTSPRLVSALSGAAASAWQPVASLLASVNLAPLLWPLYSLLAVAMAMFWFGALVVPLHARRLVRSRT